MKIYPIFIALSVTLLSLAAGAFAQDDAKPIKSRLYPEDYVYTMPEGVVAKEVTWYSEGIACWAKIFYPANFSIDAKLPGIVLAHGWTGTHTSLEKYGARFAERGLVAMAIDYRSWGNSGGFVSLVGDVETDDQRRFYQETATVQIKRTRLLPLKQVEDYRNAISYLQGEPGVDRNLIGIWGSSFSGGHIVTVAAKDGRVKAAVGQVPAVSGKNIPKTPRNLPNRILQDAIQRARTGKGGEFETGFSTPRMVDVETQQATFEYHPYHYVEEVPETTAILFIGAENEELYGPRKNLDRGVAAAKDLRGPSKYIEIPNITHFEAYSGEPFEIGSNAAADWFLQHLK